MNDTAFTTIGDEPVEVRIVAWVLGEASAFEAAELERLCAERPELNIFRRRMQALHELLRESEVDAADAAWKLGAERRAALGEIVTAAPEVRDDPARERRIRRSGRRAFLAIAACVVLTVVVAYLLKPVFVRTKRWVSQNEPMIALSPEFPKERIEGTPKPIILPGQAIALEETKDKDSGNAPTVVEPPAPSKPSAPELAANDQPVPSERSAESSLSLRLDVDESRAMASGGIVSGKMAEGGAGWNDEGAASQAPKRSMSAAESDSRDGDLAGTDDLAAKSGGFHEVDPAARSRALAKIRDQEDKVEEDRKMLSALVRTKGILNSGNAAREGSKMRETRDEALKRDLDAQEYVEAKKEFEKELEVLNEMKTELAQAPMDEEIPAAEDPYSTFSLNISDASFQIAQAAVAKGERPDPQAIKVEQFYNAVDYGDPAPVGDESVAATIEQCAHPVIPGRNLVRIALKTASAGRPGTQPLRLTLLVDQSGSMARDDRRQAMDQALDGLNRLLTDADLVNVVGFARTPRLLADGMKGSEAAKLPEIVNQAASEGGTNMEEALAVAGRMAQRRQLAGAQNRVVLFTDGAANLGDADPERLAEKIVELRQQGIAFDIAGIAADGLNDNLLAELARNGNGRYYVVGKGADDGLAKQLAGAFRPAAENVKVQVRFNPERVARYKLIGFEQDRLRTQDFRNDAVDAAELAAEEAGVAIYQVEPVPGGSGEIGEVSVRFRDTASGGMVERGWTIPYESAAPVLDRATPSMQLAVLSTLAGEKLRGGPMADSVDFKQFVEVRAKVAAFYRNSSRISGMLRLIDSL